MTRIEWKPAYQTGLAAVDHEHETLIATINGRVGSKKIVLNEVTMAAPTKTAGRAKQFPWASRATRL